ncbi:hypothetical protein KAR28_04255 [Candidatus Parcubacteria bacterium]|nr:hypothetical protein [Candidatus Parcubacteria bacterium]
MKQKLKKQDTGFTQIKNSVLNDKNLSLKAKGLFAYLFSKPDDWDFHGDRIQKDSKGGRKIIFSALKELEDLGYLERKKLSNGRMEYHIKHSIINQKEQKPVAPFGKEPKGQRAKRGNISNKDNKIIKNNKTIKILQAGACEAEIVPDLLKDKKKHIQIVGLYAKAKKINFQNKEQQSSFIKRNVRSASNLKGYDFKRIADTMKYLIDTANYPWKLETVGKFIDEDLNNINNINQGKTYDLSNL